jgi:hypothetical protein
MRRRGKAGGKTIKTQRHKTLTRRHAPGGARPRSNGQETNVVRESAGHLDVQQILPNLKLLVLALSVGDGRFLISPFSRLRRSAA